MRYISNTAKLMVIAALALCMVFSACKKDSEFFDIEDPQGIDSRIWSDEGAVGLFLNRAYGIIIPQWPVSGNIHVSSDESNMASTAFLWGTLV